MTWHFRLGHLGPQALEHLVNSSQGVRIKQEPRIKGVTTTECNACATSKLKRQIRREPRNSLEVSGKRLAIDFHDFEEEAEGYSSSMLVTDRWSGHI